MFYTISVKATVIVIKKMNWNYWVSRFILTSSLGDDKTNFNFNMKVKFHVSLHINLRIKCNHYQSLT